jgi:uncharacterized protein affecting Mg2+/Co2+ transport
MSVLLFSLVACADQDPALVEFNDKLHGAKIQLIENLLTDDADDDDGVTEDPPVELIADDEDSGVDIEVAEVWSDWDKYTGAGTWVDANATIVNHGPDPVRVWITLEMITDSSYAAGDTEGSWQEDPILLEGDSVFEYSSGVTLSSRVNSSCHWRVIAEAFEVEQEDDMTNNEGASEVFEVFAL